MSEAYIPEQLSVVVSLENKRTKSQSKTSKVNIKKNRSLRWLVCVCWWLITAIVVT